MKKFESFIYTAGTFFYLSALVLGFGLFVHLMADRNADNFSEVDKAAKEVVDGIEELRLAVEMDLRDLEKQHDFKG